VRRTVGRGGRRRRSCSSAGKEFDADAQRFPALPSEVRDNVQIDGGPFGRSHRLGLYNFHVSRDLDVLVGCGLGGTSLIMPGVAIRPRPACTAAVDVARSDPQRRQGRDIGRLLSARVVGARPGEVPERA